MIACIVRRCTKISHIRAHKSGEAGKISGTPMRFPWVDPTCLYLFRINPLGRLLESTNGTPVTTVTDTDGLSSPDCPDRDASEAVAPG